ncbi:DUF6053 domain-containing protein [Lysobacter enzymogenes]|uniref:DUF6053 domain-containing protein n=1 Tax=Lysobacter enzymogenes TaxID=69 RepID=UPI003D18A22E
MGGASAPTLLYPLAATWAQGTGTEAPPTTAFDFLQQPHRPERAPGLSTRSASGRFQPVVHPPGTPDER